jgi:hypothetical protein
MAKASTCLRDVRFPDSCSDRAQEKDSSKQGFVDGQPGKDVPGSLVDSPEAVTLGLSRKDTDALDCCLFGLAGVSRLSQDQRNAVTDVLFGFLLDVDMNVDVTEGTMALIRARRAS